MSHTRPILIASAFTALLLALGTTDALLMGKRALLPSSPLAADVGGGVTKNNGPEVVDAFASQSIEVAPPTQQSILERIVGTGKNVRSAVLLKGEDRIAFFSWMESPDVKTYFQALKDALHASFTPAVTDLRDEARVSSDRPVANFLTFRDTGIDPERLLFVRVRERLFEVHVTDGKEKEVDALMEALSK